MPPTKTAESLTKTKQVHVAEVVRHGEAVNIPEKMSIDDAIAILQRKKAYEQEVTQFSEVFNVFPWDGAIALTRVLENKFGFMMQEKIPGGFFSPDEPPEVRMVDVGFEKTAPVPWGRITMPAVSGYLETGIQLKEGRLVFMVTARVRRQHENTVREILQDVKSYLKLNSIYRGQAVKIRFTDDDGVPLMKTGEMVEPKFLDLSKISENDLVFPDEIDREFKHYVLCPIERREDTKKHVPSKRGVLLEGLPGTGKTLALTVASKKATEQGITVVYCENGRDFPEVVKFALQYLPAIVVCEDIDRLVSGTRDASIDTILNIMDGMESKKADLMFLLTSNNAEVINQPMMRPGRIDVSIHVPPPDGRAVEKLLRLYGKDFIADSEDLRGVGAILAGNIPAVIGEVVQRAKLSAIYNSKPGEENLSISAEDLKVASLSMTKQVKMLNRAPEPKLSKLEKAALLLREPFKELATGKPSTRVVTSGNGHVNDEDLTPMLEAIDEAQERVNTSK